MGEHGTFLLCLYSTPSVTDENDEHGNKKNKENKSNDNESDQERLGLRRLKRFLEADLRLGVAHVPPRCHVEASHLTPVSLKPW